MFRKIPIISLYAILLFTLQTASGRAAGEVEKVFLTPHFHYDPVFEKDQNEYTDVGFDRCRRFLSEMKKDNEYAVVFSEIDYLKPFFDTFPEERENILRLIRENRIETGGSYNEPNEMSIGGEGIIRNILYGRAYHEEVLGDKRAGVYMPFDVFGHTPQLSQILKKTRYRGTVWRKGNPPSEKWVGITVPGLPPDFLGLSPDGTTIHHRREHYKAISGLGSADQLVENVLRKKKLQDSLGLAADFGLLSSADFAYPESWLGGQCKELKENDPPIYISGPTAYFNTIGEQLDKGEMFLPEISRDFSLYHVGTALTRVNLKIGNRLTETALLGAEKFGTAAAILGASYPEEALDKAWRQLLFNQHHDGITGTCNDRSYFDMMAGYREALELATEAYSGAAAFIASKVDTAQENPETVAIVVFNQLGWKRTDVVITPFFEMPGGTVEGKELVDSNGERVPFDIAATREEAGKKLFKLKFVGKNIPSVGYKSYFLTGAKKLKESDRSLIATGTTIENEFYSITVDPARGGTIVELLDKETGRIVISPQSKHPGNELLVLREDKGPHYQAWELSTSALKAASSNVNATVKADQGKSMARLIVTGKIPRLGSYRQEIRLYPGIKRVDFLTTILEPASTDDENDRSLWAVRFPVEIKGTAPVVEDRFYAVARRESLKPLDYKTNLEQMDTLSAPYSANRWVEEGTAVRVDIEDKNGEVVDALPVRLCEIVHTRSRESVDAAQSLQRALVRRGVTCTPSYDDEDRSKDLLNRNFRFVLDTGGDNSFAKALTEKNPAGEGYLKRLESGSSRLLISIPAPDDEIPPVDTLILGAANADAMKKLISGIAESIISRKRIDLEYHEDSRSANTAAKPDDYGIALINRGTLLHSFDSNDTLVMGLFHSARWAEVQMGTRFSFPEEKHHRFQYSLYPHEGDWRDADTWRAGHEVNSPLVASISGSHKGDLPPAMSFVEIKSDSVALSAMKSAGNPLAAMKTGAEPGPHNGIVLRFYETEGKEDTVKAKFFKQITGAWRANMLEEPDANAPITIQNGNAIEFEIGPNAVETVVVELKNANSTAGGPSVARKTEPSNVLFSNYWDLNRGAAYMGNSPVSVTVDFPLEKDLPDPALLQIKAIKLKKNKINRGKNKLRLTVSNNSTDEKISGELIVKVPAPWESEPAHMKLELAPLEGRLVELKVDATEKVKGGYVRAEFKVGEITYFDALRIGEAVELDASAEIKKDKGEHDKIFVTIRNNQGGIIQGEVEPIGPVETWPYSLVGEFSIVEVTPGLTPFSLDKNETTSVSFNIEQASPEIYNNYFWLVIKITHNDNIKYMPVVVRD
ncbi:MAG: glycoside hydrolase family 38 C-terminal domain-containing protein [bacterium]